MSERRTLDESKVRDALRGAAVRADEGWIDMALLAQRRRRRGIARAAAMAGAAVAAVAVVVGVMVANPGEDWLVRTGPPAAGGSSGPVESSAIPTMSAQRRDVVQLCGAPPSRITNWDGLEVVPRDDPTAALHQYDSALATSSAAASLRYDVVYQSDMAMDVVASDAGKPVAVLGFDSAADGWRLAVITYC